MEVYNFNTKENVSDFTFESNINLAKKILKEKNNLNEDSISLMKDQQLIEYSVNSIEYSGRLIEFEIKNDIEIIGYLNCFKSDGNDCIEILTFQ